MSVKTFLRLLAGIFIASAILVLAWQALLFMQSTSGYPAGMTMAGIPVGGLSQEQAVERLMEVYDAPVHANFNDQTISLKPSMMGFVLDLNSMFAEAKKIDQRSNGLQGFWRFLWRQNGQPDEVVLATTVDEDKMRAFLRDEIQPRYDQPAAPYLPVPGGMEFTAGSPGLALDIDATLPVLIAAMSNPAERTVTLPAIESVSVRPPLDILQTMLRQLFTVANFSGVAEIYYEELNSGETLNFALDNGAEIPPDVPFTAASLIKIPVMTAMFGAVDLPLTGAMETDLKLMIDKSDNASTDEIMRKYLGGNLAPVTVTQEVRAMGLNNTFLAGYFYLGAPLLDRISTPANQRTDVKVSLDAYNQTTAADMATILKLLYQCGEQGAGLAEIFTGKITREKCDVMLEVLRNNRLPQLITAGLPEGTWIGQKHGWVIEDDGIMHTIVNSGIIKSPGGDYVLSIFLYHPRQLLYDPANELMVNLSKAIYNYAQLPRPDQP